jgi:hypothetical protein
MEFVGVALAEELCCGLRHGLKALEGGDISCDLVWSSGRMEGGDHSMWSGVSGSAL